MLDGGRAHQHLYSYDSIEYYSTCLSHGAYADSER